MNTETILVGKNGLEIIKIYIPPGDHRAEFYNLYRVEGYPHCFLCATKAWAKAEELQES